MGIRYKGLKVYNNMKTEQEIIEKIKELKKIWNNYPSMNTMNEIDYKIEMLNWVLEDSIEE